MGVVLVILVGYFSAGLLALCVLDALTGRVRNRLRSASVEVQDGLATTGSFVGRRSSVVLLLVALWLFWPAAIYGALASLRSTEEQADEQKG